MPSYVDGLTTTNTSSQHGSSGTLTTRCLNVSGGIPDACTRINPRAGAGNGIGTNLSETGMTTPRSVTNRPDGTFGSSDGQRYAGIKWSKGHHPRMTQTLKRTGKTG